MSLYLALFPHKPPPLIKLISFLYIFFISDVVYGFSFVVTNRTLKNSLGCSTVVLLECDCEMYNYKVAEERVAGSEGSEGKIGKNCSSSEKRTGSHQIFNRIKYTNVRLKFKRLRLRKSLIHYLEAEKLVNCSNLRIFRHVSCCCGMLYAGILFIFYFEK